MAHGQQAIELLRQRGAKSIVLEAGPQTTAQAYSEKLVDELMLSTYLGPFPEGMNETVAPFDLPALDTAFAQKSGTVEIDDPSGRWTFERRWR